MLLCDCFKVVYSLMVDEVWLLWLCVFSMVVSV